MEKTGERYTTARKVLLEATPTRKRKWVSDPDISEDRLIETTGRGWDEWCDVIVGWPGHVDGHTAIASYLETELDVGSWWAQGITVGYERITGLRLPFQMADRTFTAGKSKTIGIDSAVLRESLLDDQQRSALFGGEASDLRSKPESKVVRVAIGPGVAQIALDPVADGRTKVSVAHEKLLTLDDVDKWKFFWTDWLEAIAEAAAD